jgi:glyoxalase family protein
MMAGAQGGNMNNVRGLHHVTAIAGPAQQNLDFYAGVLGMRLVKRSVNQDDPATYHLFYADAVGHPGTDLTFFPWSQLAPSRDGHGLSVEVSLSVPPDSLTFWRDRLRKYGAQTGDVETRFGRQVLPFIDPHGLRVALVERDDLRRRSFTPWKESPIPVERQIRGLDSARLRERDLGPTTRFLTEVLGFKPLATENGWQRYGVEGGGSGADVDVQEAPAARRGAWGVGSVHHLAWRVDDDAHQAAVRQRVAAAGSQPTPVIDRFWFKSVYFREPGGVLFEIATDDPGFAADEAPESLGRDLKLPRFLEPRRREIEAVLEPLG